MKKGSEYRYVDSYKLGKISEQKGHSAKEHPPKGYETSSLSTTRHDSEGGISLSEVSGEPKPPNTKAEEIEHVDDDMTTPFLRPLAQDPHKPNDPEEDADQKEYIGDNVVTGFLQDPLTTILYGSHQKDKNSPISRLP